MLCDAEVPLFAPVRREALYKRGLDRRGDSCRAPIWNVGRELGQDLQEARHSVAAVGLLGDGQGRPLKRTVPLAAVPAGARPCRTNTAVRTGGTMHARVPDAVQQTREGQASTSVPAELVQPHALDGPQRYA